MSLANLPLARVSSNGLRSKLQGKRGEAGSGEMPGQLCPQTTPRGFLLRKKGSVEIFGQPMVSTLTSGR